MAVGVRSQRLMHLRLWPVLAGLILGLAGCVQQPGGPPGKISHVMGLRPVGFDRLPGWRADHTADALPPFLAGCAMLVATPPDQLLGGQGMARELGGSSVQWRPACAAASAVPPGDDTAARTFFQTWFQPYALSDNGSPQGLFTGYYEPEVRGSRSPGGIYNVPLLGLPNDLVLVDLGAFADDLKGRHLTGRVQNGRLEPYYDRAAIVRGVLHGQRLGLLWLRDPIDAFFLQIQGACRVRLQDGQIARVSYAGQNGRPYVPIGRILADRGHIRLDQVSMQSIRGWLDSHPSEAADIMNQNLSYVFFRELASTPPDQGPPGALGVALTPARSVAIDRQFVPLGAPLWIDTTDPLDGSKVQRLTLAQDLGGAIRGPVRADIFWGWGPEADARAGRMRQSGSAYALLPRPTAQAR
jgi:membrane-bound lytic murein transglycosylase A